MASTAVSIDAKAVNTTTSSRGSFSAAPAGDQGHFPAELEVKKGDIKVPLSSCLRASSPLGSDGFMAHSLKCHRRCFADIIFVVDNQNTHNDSSGPQEKLPKNTIFG
jgi:hypothetical protein